MEAIAREIEQGYRDLPRGRVKGSQPGLWLVETEGEIITARQGFSCLYAPEAGDLVLLSLGTEGNYILAILERTSGNPGLLKAENGLRISAPEREVVVEADRGVSLQSADRVSLSSARLTMQSSQMELSADRMSLFGRVIHTQAQRIRNTAESVENLFSRLKEKLLQSHRKVEGMDLVQAAHITREAEDLYAAHSGYTVMTCREDMKIDAEHIHLG